MLLFTYFKTLKNGGTQHALLRCSQGCAKHNISNSCLQLAKMTV